MLLGVDWSVVPLYRARVTPYSLIVWPTKARLVLAVIAEMQSNVPSVDTGDVREDLTRLVTMIGIGLNQLGPSLVAALASAAAGGGRPDPPAVLASAGRPRTAHGSPGGYGRAVTVPRWLIVVVVILAVFVRVFTPEVLVADPGRELRWIGQLWSWGFFDGEHSFVIDEIALGRVRLTQSEVFRGVLVPFLAGSLHENTQPQFAAMNKALAERVAGLVAGL